MDIAIPIFDGITALDAVGPCEVLSRLPGARIAGPDVARAIQLGIEYDPQPPFDAGSTAKAPASVVELVRSVASRYA